MRAVFKRIFMPVFWAAGFIFMPKWTLERWKDYRYATRKVEIPPEESFEKSHEMIIMADIKAAQNKYMTFCLKDAPAPEIPDWFPMTEIRPPGNVVCRPVIEDGVKSIDPIEEDWGYDFYNDNNPENRLKLPKGRIGFHWIDRGDNDRD